MRQVGAANNRSHTAEGPIAHFVLVEQALESTAAVAMAQLGATDIEWDPNEFSDVASARHELKCGVWVYEAPDRPGCRRSVYVDPFASDEVHAHCATETVNVG